ncbi:MAG: DUF3499 family protein [Acidimicrobiales bacterium]|nr:DUF3499 domain-containing protein [Actinomycetota bacterium]
MERARLCSRPGCAQPATATLVFQYADRTLWLQDLAERDPHTIDLCTMHADRLSPPRGWVGEDRRRTAAGPPALAAS